MLTEQSTVLEKSTNLFEVCEYNQRLRFLGLCRLPPCCLQWSRYTILWKFCIHCNSSFFLIWPVISRMSVCLYGKSLKGSWYCDLPLQNKTRRNSYNEVENPEWSNRILKWQWFQLSLTMWTFSSEAILEQSIVKQSMTLKAKRFWTLWKSLCFSSQFEGKYDQLTWVSCLQSWNKHPTNCVEVNDSLKDDFFLGKWNSHSQHFLCIEKNFIPDNCWL